ncbi:hypothetical protein GMRT_21130 [Giardia muris]|uniref:Myb-like DNA-binding domain-containing protein n=1 Tax=Giardia muris TaxID=5742 RepID=A0A4Z1T3T5_GIAMU|nr:hypothetical protein GMRT_21130 [Giardia muris]|eukprot:TNJ30308.1 hypothetical protein GMRT_21130 [Giardia muris]
MRHIHIDVPPHERRLYCSAKPGCPSPPPWTRAEDIRLIAGYLIYGPNWKILEGLLPGRSTLGIHARMVRQVHIADQQPEKGQEDEVSIFYCALRQYIDATGSTLESCFLTHACYAVIPESSRSFWRAYIALLAH